MGLGDQPPDVGPLPSGSRRWTSWVVRELIDLRQRYNALTGNSTATASGSTTNSMTLQQQLGKVIAAQAVAKTAQEATAAVVAQLAAASTIYQDSFDDTAGITGFTGFYSGTAAQVVAQTPSGKMELVFGGSLNSGNGYFGYSVKQGATVIIDRTTVQADYSQRVAIIGGASFAPSGTNTVILEGLPSSVDLTITLELNAAASLVFFLGGRIVARPTL